MKTIGEILSENAARWPEREAILTTRHGADRALTFRELEASSLRFASALAARGLRHGDPVLVFVPMSLELYVALLGLFRLGAVAVFIDPSAGLRHIEACCARQPPKALISIWPLRLLRPFVGGLRRIPLVLPPPALHSAGTTPIHLTSHPAPADPALITFTSGSTGQPKAAVRSHEFLIAQYEALKDSIQLREGERDLTTLPVFVLANLAAGITSILPDAKISRPGSVDPHRIATQARRLTPNRTGGSPAFYQRLLAAPESLASFKKIYTGGAPVFPSFLQKLQAAAPRAEVVAVYGSTEAEPIAHLACHEISPSDWDAMRAGRGLLAGPPIPEIRLRILPDQWGHPVTNFQNTPARQIGEILVTGAHVLKSYLHGHGNEETKVSIDGDIWHRTGDAGYLDETGRLWLVGRCSARIHDAHGTLYPFTVECVAMTFPFIRRAAFIQIADRRTLIVEPDGSPPPAFEETLTTACAWARLAEVRTIPHIPVDTRHNAKIDYPKLRKML